MGRPAPLARGSCTIPLESGAGRDFALFAKHIMVEPRIVVTGGTATVESYFLRVEPRDAGPTEIVASGRYRDRLTRCEDGHWRFVERIAEIDDM